MSNKPDTYSSADDIEGVARLTDKAGRRTSTGARELRKRILELHEQGKRRQHIMRELDLGKAAYDYHVGKLRGDGLMMPKDRVINSRDVVLSRFSRMNVKTGRMPDVFRNTTSDFINWVMFRITKEGYDDMAEFLRDTLLDAYEDDQEWKDGQ